MEMNKKSSHSKEKPTMGRSSSSSEVKKPAEKDLSSPTFVNQAAICWHESRKKWVDKNSQQQQRMERESMISWSTAYEDLLSTNDPFSEPIPLPEMVDFLVDIWHDEGLFD
uniref:Gag1-like clamp domain-containing protein n=1 Tax=Cucumis sativus TaxID=3659 RepID=A0A0A0LK63_CUCSA